ncbi:MAG: hypothetical protein ACP5UH_02170 [Candidatus Micrarchaeia archaeon]
MNVLMKWLLSMGKDPAYDDTSKKQKVIKLNDNTYQIVWADEYDNWMRYFKDTGKLE